MAQRIAQHLDRSDLRWAIYMPTPAEPQLPNPLFRARLPGPRMSGKPVVVQFGGKGGDFGEAISEAISVPPTECKAL